MATAIQKITLSTSRDIPFNKLILFKPTCPNGTPEIYSAPVVFSDNGVGLPLIGVQSWAVDHGKTWTVRLVITTQNAAGTGAIRVSPSATYGQVLALAKCT
jgi:hypothetical protein